MTQRDEPGELVVGFRYGRQSRWRWLFSLRRSKTQAPSGPQADWVLAYIGTGWTLRLRSCSPGDLDLPPVYGTSDIARDNTAAAHEWALSVLPPEVEHTVGMVR